MIALSHSSYRSWKKFLMPSSTAGDVGLNVVNAAFVRAAAGRRDAVDCETPPKPPVGARIVSGVERRRNFILVPVMNAEIYELL
jgi:hypothetical protein